MQNGRVKPFTVTRFNKKSSVENILEELEHFKGHSSNGIGQKLNKSPSNFFQASTNYQKLGSPERFVNNSNSPSKTNSPFKNNNPSLSSLPQQSKGMFSYPKLGHLVGNSSQERLNYFQDNSSYNNFSFKNRDLNEDHNNNKTLDKFKTKSFSNLLNNNNNKDSSDTLSVVSFSTSKFDLNKFKITKKSANDLPNPAQQVPPLEIKPVQAQPTIKEGLSSEVKREIVFNEENKPNGALDTQGSAGIMNSINNEGLNINLPNEFTDFHQIIRQGNIPNPKQDESKPVSAPLQKTLTFADNSTLNREQESSAKSPKILPTDINNRRMTIEYIKLVMKVESEKNIKVVIDRLGIDPSILSYTTSSPKKSFKIITPSVERISKFLSKPTTVENKVREPEIISAESVPKSEFMPLENKATALNLSLLASVGSFKFDPESQEKVKMIYDLMVPRVLSLKINNQLTPFLVKVVPSNLCYTHGLEYYMLEFVNITNRTEKMVIEIVDIHQCSKINETCFKISMLSQEDDFELISYEIMSPNNEITDLYVKAISYTSQMVKEKLKSYKKVR